MPINVPEERPEPRFYRLALGIWIAVTVGFLAVAIAAFFWTTMNEHSKDRGVVEEISPTKYVLIARLPWTV